ncbi:MAG: hypothetical protein JKX97_04400 [Candidatus Lindowbacteria bacterium]|nr:hypothetical protein [Candidatus Lindowbacteria bacterium]
MARVIVYRWPEGSAALLDKRFRRATVRDEIDHVEDQLPDEWLTQADEIRVSIGKDVFFRTLDLGGLSSMELHETARNWAEPTLPIPLDDLTTSVIPSGKMGKGRRYLLSAIPNSKLDAALADTRKILGVDSNGNGGESATTVPVSWVGPCVAGFKPTGDENVRSENWAGVADQGNWEVVQCANKGANAAQDLENRFDDRELTWVEATRSAEYKAIASAGPSGSWRMGPPKKREKIFRNWPYFLLAASLLLVFMGFGARLTAADRRIKNIDARSVAIFKSVLPNTPVRSPADQIRSRFRKSKLKYEFVKNRFGKKGSAFEVLSAIDENVDPSLVEINDMSNSDKRFSIVGSAMSVELAQGVGKELEQNLPLVSRDKVKIDVQTLRSGSGYGIDFTIKGER